MSTAKFFEGLDGFPTTVLASSGPQSPKIKKRKCVRCSTYKPAVEFIGRGALCGPCRNDRTPAPSVREAARLPIGECCCFHHLAVHVRNKRCVMPGCPCVEFFERAI